MVSTQCVDDNRALGSIFIIRFKSVIGSTGSYTKVYFCINYYFIFVIGEHILYKWTNIRDTFVKTLKTKLGRPKKKYLLHNHLKFLTKIVPEDERGTGYTEESATYLKQEIEPETSFSGSNAIDKDTSFTVTNEVEPETTVNSYRSKKRSKRSDFDDTQSTDYSISGVSYGKNRSKRNDFDEAKSTDYCASEFSYSGKKRKSSRLIFAEDMDDSRSSIAKKKTKKGSLKNVEDNTNDAPTNDSNDIDFVDIDDNDPRIMNEDEAFFASLLPTIVKYNEDERLEFRIEVLSVMKKIKEKRIWPL